MHVVIVYESMFGNTHRIADAIADGILGADSASIVSSMPVADATPQRFREAELLIVGGPTHFHGLPSGVSRTVAARQAADLDKKHPETGPHDLEPEAEGGPGLRKWFHDMVPAGYGRHAAAFDTRADSVMAGGAAHGIARRLRHHGFELVAEPEGFIIEGPEGAVGLRPGEIERARAWGASLLKPAVTP